MTDRQNDLQPQQPRPYGLLGYATLGVEFGAAFGIGLAGGMLLDEYAGTEPVWTLVGTAVGFAAGMYRLVGVAWRYQRNLPKRPDEQAGHGPDRE